MGMLIELAAANAAFKIIKATINNGQDIYNAGSALSKYFGAEKAINKQVKAGTGNVMEAFQAQEQLKKNEEALKFMLNKQRLQGYVDFCKFRSDYNKGIKLNKINRSKANAKQSKSDDTTIALVLSLVILMLILCSGAFYFVAKLKGWI